MEINLKCKIEECKNSNHINGICLYHYGFIPKNKFMKSWGNMKSSDGYNLGKYNGKLVKVHRLVVEAYIKRNLKADEHIHHINHNKNDNRIENLQIISRQEHVKIHALERSKNSPEIKSKTCARCGKEKEISKFKIQSYSKITGHKKRKATCRDCKIEDKMHKKLFTCKLSVLY